MERSKAPVGVMLCGLPPAKAQVRERGEGVQFGLVVEAHPRRAVLGLVGTVVGVLREADRPQVCAGVPGVGVERREAGEREEA